MILNLQFSCCLICCVRLYVFGAFEGVQALGVRGVVLLCCGCEILCLFGFVVNLRLSEFAVFAALRFCGCRNLRFRVLWLSEFAVLRFCGFRDMRQCTSHYSERGPKTIAECKRRALST